MKNGVGLPAAAAFKRPSPSDWEQVVAAKKARNQWPKIAIEKLGHGLLVRLYSTRMSLA